MRCPACDSEDTRVIDSRTAADSVRRRRECQACGGRFTTFERVEMRPLWVLKRSGAKEPFRREKVLEGISHACRKRPVTPEALDTIVTRVARLLEERREPVIPSTVVGETVLDVLRDVDEVAWVRFASVYGAFDTVDQFVDAIRPGPGRRRRWGGRARGVRVTDAEAMREALALTRRAVGTTAPNPPVGAVIVRDGVVIGRGFTKPPGGPHAEVEAMRDARDAGHDLRGATMVVTLEPCCHHGRTPPCTDAIVAAGLGRVVVGVVDPYEKVRGRGIELLRAAGIDVSLGVLAGACQDAMRGFLRVEQGGLPEVTLKVATSLDGSLATASGESQWITGELARAHAHDLRATHDAILVGAGTQRADDPRLTCRTLPDRDPVPVIVSTSGTLGADAAVFGSSRRPVIVCAEDAVVDPSLPVDVVRAPRAPAGLDLPAALRALGRRGLHRILVEGGAGIHRSMIDAGLADRLLVYVAGVVIPGGRPWLDGPPLAQLADARRLGSPDVTPLGPDVLLRYTLARPSEEG